MTIFNTVLPHLNPDDLKPSVFKYPLAQLDYYQTYDRAGNKLACEPLIVNNVLVGGFVESTALSSAILVDRIHPVKKECFDLLSWAANNSGGGVQVIYKQ